MLYSSGLEDEDMDMNPTLLGIAIDVSGSMTSSIRNNQALDLSRLGGVERGLGALLEDSRSLAQKYSGESDLPLQIFAYAFGLTVSPGYCDLFTTLQVARNIEQDADFQEFVEQSKRRRIAEAERRGEQMRRQSSGYGGLGSLARSFGFGREVDRIKRNLEEDARKKLTREVEEGVKEDATRYLQSRIEQIGDTTMSVSELSEMWAGGGGAFNDAKRFIFGSTPMRACLSEVEQRFEREGAL